MKILSRFERAILWTLALGLFGGCGSGEDATPPAKPKIVLFEASERDIEAGEEVTLSWATKHVSSITITANGAEVDLGQRSPEADALVLTIDETTVFELVAYGAKNASVSASVTVSAVKITPEILSFTATPETVEEGEEVTLAWETEGADQVRIIRDDTIIYEGNEPAGSTSEIPPLSSTYRLEASRADKMAVVETTVKVGPRVISFAPRTTAPTPVGAMVELDWSVRGATEITLSNDDGAEEKKAVSAFEEGRTALPLGSGGRFTLTAKSGELVALAEAQLPVLQPPLIASFEAARSVMSANPGDRATVTLGWTGIERAERLELVGDTTGPVDLSGANLADGEIEVEIAADTEFTLSAINAAGQAEARAAVKLVPFPSILHFAALPAYTGENESFELVWEAMGSEVELTEAGVPIPGVDPGMLSGRITLQTPVSSSYVLTVKNQAGDSLSKTVDLTVGPLQNTSLAISPTYVAVGDPLTISWTNLGGRMLEIRDEEGAALCTITDPEDIADGSCTITVSTEGEHVFHFHLENTLGDEISDTLEAFASDGPRILAFSASPEEANAGEPITFTWEVMDDPHGNTPSLTLSDGDQDFPLDEADPNQDSRAFAMDQVGALTLELTATTPLGAKTATVDLTIHGLPVVEFTASPASYDLVTPVHLEWATKYADDSLVLYALDEAGEAIEPPLYEIPEAERANASFSVEPTTPTTYRLVAKNALGAETSEEVEVGILPPEIASFAVDRDLVNKEKSESERTVTLSWSGVERANLLELSADTLGPIDIDSLDPSADSIAIAIEESTLFTLSAENAGGTTTKTVLVEAIPFAGIKNFVATPSYVEEMEPFTLEWETKDAVEIEILADGAPVPGIDPTETSGSIILQDPVSTDYTLLAKNLLGDETEKKLTVEVGPAEIINFGAVPDRHYALGEQVWIYWHTRGGRSLRLFQDGHQVFSTTSQTQIDASSHLPTLTEVGVYEFTLEIDNHLGDTVAKSLTIRVSDGPTILHFDATPDAIDVGDSITFSWEVLDDPDGETPTLTLSDGTKDYDLSGEDPNLGNKTISFPNEGTYTFTLTATTSMGSTSEDLTVNVYSTDPLILSFTATPPEQVRGAKIDLSWTTRNVSEVTLGRRLAVETSEPFIDISTTGTELQLTDLCGTREDERCADIVFPAGFKFPFGGSDREELRVMENGFVTFNTDFVANTYFVERFPATYTTGKNVHIAPFWNDLALPSGVVYYEFNSDARGDHLIIQWKDAVHQEALGPTSFTFQLILWDEGTFDFRYETMQSDESEGEATASIGYQSPDAADVLSIHHGAYRYNFLGGLSNRSFSFVSDSLPPNGNLEIVANLDLDELRLIGSGPAGVVEETISVIVHTPIHLIASWVPYEPILGETFSVRAYAIDADSIQVEDEQGDIICSGASPYPETFKCPILASSLGPHAYKVKAFGPADQVVEQVVEVEVFAPFELHGFDADKLELDYGEDLTLSWSATGAASASLTANGIEILPTGVDPNYGQLVLSDLAERTTFIFEITPPDSRPPKSKAIEVLVRNFDMDVSASATSVSAGDPVTLSWNIDSPTGGTPRIFQANARMVEVDLVAEPDSAFQDIRSTGTKLDFSHDFEFIDLLDYGFEFPYFANSYDFIYAFRTGFTSFESNWGILEDVNAMLPSKRSGASHIHLAPYWGSRLPQETTLLYHQHFQDPTGPDYVVIQWSVSDGEDPTIEDWNFQAVLFEDGTFEYRYGTMDPADEPTSRGMHRTIGFAFGEEYGSTLHFGGTAPFAGPAFLGGLAYRTFRASPLDGNSTVVFPEVDTDYEICGALGGYLLCKTVSVEVTGAPPSIDVFSVAPDEVFEGDPIEIEWSVQGATTVHLGSLVSMEVSETNTPFSDISSSGSQLSLTNLCGAFADERCADLAFPSGFHFPFAGRKWDAIRVMENGHAGFNFDFDGDSFRVGIPSDDTTHGDNAHLAPFWADLDMRAGSVFYEFGTDSRGQYLILQWENAMELRDPNSSLQFQMVLWEDGAFEYRYGTMISFNPPTIAEGRWSAIGYQSPSREHFFRLNPNASAVQGGLSQRSWIFEPSALPSEGSVQIKSHPSMNEIELSALNSDGETSASVPITVHPRTTLIAWTSVAEPVEVGDTLKLFWNTKNAHSLWVEDEWGSTVCTAAVDKVQQGECLLPTSMAGTYAYSVKARGALNQEVVEEIEVVVIERLAITSFEAEEHSILVNSSAKLNWTTIGAVETFLSANGGPPIGPLASSGHYVSAPLSQETTFVLTAFSADGREVSKALEVSIRTFDLSLTASETSVAPGSAVALSWTIDPPPAGTPTYLHMNAPLVEVDLVAEPSAAFVDISSTGTKLDSSEPSIEVDLSATGFSFPFGGKKYSRMWIEKNGYLSFDPPPSGTLNENLELPSAEVSRVHLAAYWGFVCTSCSFHYQLEADPTGPDRLIIQFRDDSQVRDWSYQFVLYENGIFEYRYGTMGPAGDPYAQGANRTIGYQVSESTGYTLHHSESYLDTFPSDLSNRTFRLQEIPGSPLVIHPVDTAEQMVCAYISGEQVCSSIEIEAPWGIVSFTADDYLLPLGAMVTVRWETVNPDWVTLTTNGVVTSFPPSLHENGHFSEPLTKDMHYTLTFSSLGRIETQSLVVRYKSFDLELNASQTTVSPGDSVTFTWTASNPLGHPVSLYPPFEEVDSTTHPFVDISADPTATLLIGGGSDDEFETYPFPPSTIFPIHGTWYSEMNVHTDGVIRFGITSRDPGKNQMLPSVYWAPYVIAPFWDDLHTRSSGRVHALTTAYGSVIVQWSHMSPKEGSSDFDEYDLNFQVELFDGGAIEFRYGTMDSGTASSPNCYPTSDCQGEANGASATIGYQGIPAGQVIHFGGTEQDPSQKPFPGGLSNRSFRVERGQSGSYTQEFTESGTFEICGTYSGYSTCESVEIEVVGP